MYKLTYIEVRRSALYTIYNYIQDNIYIGNTPQGGYSANSTPGGRTPQYSRGYSKPPVYTGTDRPSTRNMQGKGMEV